MNFLAMVDAKLLTPDSITSDVLCHDTGMVEVEDPVARTGSNGFAQRPICGRSQEVINQRR